MNFYVLLFGGGALAVILWTALCKHWERIENRNYDAQYGEDYLP